MDTVEIIRQNLSAIGEDYDSLKPFMKKWLEKVETAIQSRKSIQEERLIYCLHRSAACSHSLLPDR